MKQPRVITWPKLKRDWTGMTVILIRPLRTKGGTRFGRGMKMTVDGYYQGLKLSKRGRGSITRVSTRDVKPIKR